MKTLSNTRYHIISIIYISLMAMFIALGVVVYMNQYASADYIQGNAYNTSEGASESFMSEMPSDKSVGNNYLARQK